MSTSWPFLTAFEKQLDFLNAFFPAALSFFDVQLLAVELIPTSGFLTSVTRFITLGPIALKPVPLTQSEVDRLLHKEVAVRERTRAQFSIGESVKVVSGPLSDFSGEISEINEDAGRLKVLVSIFGRETPVEVGFDQVKKL